MIVLLGLLRGLIILSFNQDPLSLHVLDNLGHQALEECLISVEEDRACVSSGILG